MSDRYSRGGRFGDRETRKTRFDSEFSSNDRRNNKGVIPYDPQSFSHQDPETYNSSHDRFAPQNEFGSSGPPNHFGQYGISNEGYPPSGQSSRRLDRGYESYSNNYPTTDNRVPRFEHQSRRMPMDHRNEHYHQEEQFGRQQFYGEKQGSSNYRGGSHDRDYAGHGRNRERDFQRGGRNEGYRNEGFNGREDPPAKEIIEDTVFVSNLPLDVTEEELANLFGSIGLIKVDKRTGLNRIKIYTNQDGSCKGEASITYDDPPTTSAAIQWFNQTDVRGCRINVQMAERTYSVGYASRGGRGRGRYDGGGFERSSSRYGQRRQGDNGSDGGNQDQSLPPRKKFVMQPGDWPCSKCGNNNFAWRNACNKCGLQKPEGDTQTGVGSGSFGPSDEGRHRSVNSGQNLGYRAAGGPGHRGRSSPRGGMARMHHRGQPGSERYPPRETPY